MDYKIAICDDSNADRESIAGMVRRWAEAAGHTVQVSEFPSAESFLFQYADDKNYDILLLDVEMGDLSGIDLAKRVRAARGRAELGPVCRRQRLRRQVQRAAEVGICLS